MSLSATINAARSALNVSSLGIQIAGNNMANVATPGYSRQIAMLKALQGTTNGQFQVGGGVGIADVQRKVDEALMRRLRSGISDEHAAASKVATFSQLESVLNELTGFDLSSSLNDFFGVWSEATSLLESGSVVVEQGAKLANSIQNLRSEMTLLRRQTEDQIDQTSRAANSILNEIAGLNAAITASEIGQSKANALRDQRDQMVAELSTLVDVNTVEDGQGNLDVLIGSTPVIIGGTNRGLDIQRETNDEGVLEVSVIIADGGTPVSVSGGKIGGLLESRDGAIDRAIKDLDELAGQLIFEINKLHSTGSSRDGYAALKSTLQVPTADRALALNDPNNSTLSNLPFAPENGGFFINVQNATTGASEAKWIEVDLDGLDNAGLPGFGDDTSAEDIRAAIDATDGLRATWSADGKLEIAGETGYTFSFSEDSSSALAVLGVNSYFEGTSGSDIAVRADLKESPSLLGLGNYNNGRFVENGTALGIAQLQDQSLASMGNRTVSSFWGDAVQRVAVTASTAYNEAHATALVRESLESQRSAMSGVSLDEESINLITFQQQYQGAARLIQIADQMTQELLNIL
ncbi:MAG: flagellar hook-associated protein 1 FlgK [Phycisphaerales bacterium]|jgi:flagellar hook-associated protein 1 FlgK